MRSRGRGEQAGQSLGLPGDLRDDGSHPAGTNPPNRTRGVKEGVKQISVSTKQDCWTSVSLIV